MTFKPGHSGNPAGKPKGTKNKSSKKLVEDILEAFDQLGGIDWLVKIAKDDPKLVTALIARVVPRNIKVGPDEETWEAMLRRLRDAKGIPSEA